MTVITSAVLAPGRVESKHRGRRRRWHPGHAVTYVLLLGLAATTVYPLVFVIGTAFKSNGAYQKSTLSIPSSPTVSNFSAAWRQASVGTFSLHSLIVVSLSVVVIALAASMAGYALTHVGFTWSRYALAGVIGLMMLPSSTIMIPLFRTVQQLHLLDRFAGLTLVYCALQLPFSTYLMSAYFRRVPKEVVEAARVDGAGPWRTLVEVCLPLVRPGLLTLVTLNFLWLWNELLYALLIAQNNSHRTLMVGLALLNGEHSTAIPLIAAGLVFALIPPLVVFGFFQRNLAEGVTAGAVK